MLELYGAASCQFTSELRQRLELEGREFIEYDVESDAAALDRMKALTGQSMVPVLVEYGKPVAIGWRGRGCVVG